MYKLCIDFFLNRISRMNAGEYILNHQEVSNILSSCTEELQNIKSIIDGLGEAAKPIPYLKKYAVVRASGAIEISFKQIVADKIDENSHERVKFFIKRKIRDSSSNPKLGNIQNLLSEFDTDWRRRFDEQISLENKQIIEEALKELVNARNCFAHGGESTILEIDKTISCFENGIKAIKILDTIVHQIEEGVLK